MGFYLKPMNLNLSNPLLVSLSLLGHSSSFWWSGVRNRPMQFHFFGFYYSDMLAVYIPGIYQKLLPYPMKSGRVVFNLT